MYTCPICMVYYNSNFDINARNSSLQSMLEQHLPLLCPVLWKKVWTKPKRKHEVSLLQFRDIEFRGLWRSGEELFRYNRQKRIFRPSIEKKNWRINEYATIFTSLTRPKLKINTALPNRWRLSQLEHRSDRKQYRPGWELCGSVNQEKPQ